MPQPQKSRALFKSIPMQKLKIAAAIVILVLGLVSFVYSYDYYKAVFASFFSAYSINSNILSLLLAILLIIRELLIFALAAVYLVVPDPQVKDKAYRLLRFIFVICFFFYLPFTVYYLTAYYENADWLNRLIYYGNQLCSLFCIVALLVAKPEKPVKKIDVSEYELVNYTSMGHRFLHYLLDILFLLPFWLLLVNMIPYPDESGYTLLLRSAFILLYLFYCLISEAIFRQTFGKLVTNSCVVSNGINLTFGRVIIRTLCRIIPFNAISFLFRANWHDKVSSTAVVYIDTWEKVFDDQPAHDMQSA